MQGAGTARGGRVKKGTAATRGPLARCDDAAAQCLLSAVRDVDENNENDWTKLGTNNPQRWGGKCVETSASPRPERMRAYQH